MNLDIISSFSLNICNIEAQTLPADFGWVFFGSKSQQMILPLLEM